MMKVNDDDDVNFDYVKNEEGILFRKECPSIFFSFYVRLF